MDAGDLEKRPSDTINTEMRDRKERNDAKNLNINIYKKKKSSSAKIYCRLRRALLKSCHGFVLDPSQHPFRTGMLILIRQ